MERTYTDGVKNDVVFFTGIEIEKTPAYGMKTLFVVGTHRPDNIAQLANTNNCKHIFAGANHSFDPGKYIDREGDLRCWDDMLITLLEQGFTVSLDFDVKYIETVLDAGYCKYNNFIPQISVKVPHINQFNNNAMLKIDDKDFKASNPGVWCHKLHDLMDSTKFTGWIEYGKDQPL